MFDGEAFGAEIVAQVRSHVSNSIAPLLSEISVLKARIADLETREPLRGEKGKDGEPGLPGRDGKDAEDIKPAIIKFCTDAAIEIQTKLEQQVSERLTNLKDGRDGESIIGPSGKDGVGIASAFIDREGNLVLTFTDGTVGSVGKVVGADGAPGKDGEKGKDGRDGLGFDDIQVAMLEDGHTVEIKFIREDITKTFPVVFPNMKYCQIFSEGREYMIGDLVTWAGSLWHCNDPTKEKPGTGSPHWTLATKRGRDGKDGQSIQGPPGPQGRPGRDLTQMGPDGVKF